MSNEVKNRFKEIKLSRNEPSLQRRTGYTAIRIKPYYKVKLQKHLKQNNISLGDIVEQYCETL